MAFDLNSLTGISIGGALGPVAKVTNVILVLLVLGVGGYMLWHFYGYKQIVLIFKKTGSGIRVYKDKGKLVKKNGITGLHLLWRKIFLPQPTAEQTFMLGKKEMILYEWKGNQQLLPVTIFPWRKITDKQQDQIKTSWDEISEVTFDEQEDTKLKTIPSEILLWMGEKSRRTIDSYKKPNKWQVLMPYVGLAFSAAIFIMVVIFILDKFEVLNGVAGSLKATADVLKSIHIQTVTGAPPG